MNLNFPSSVQNVTAVNKLPTMSFTPRNRTDHGNGGDIPGNGTGFSLTQSVSRTVREDLTSETH